MDRYLDLAAPKPAQPGLRKGFRHALPVQQLPQPTLTPAAHPRTRTSALLLVRLAWLAVAALSLGLFAASIPARYAELSSPAFRLYQTGMAAAPPNGYYAAYTVGLEMIVALVFSTVALIIFRRKSQDAVGIIVSFMLLLAGSALRPIVVTLDALVATEPGWLLPIRCLTYLTWCLVFAFFCVFPDGRFASRWTMALLGCIAALLVPWEFFPDAPLSPWTWSPLAFIALTTGLIGASIYAQVQRYRSTSDQEQRQQTRWIVYGMTTTLVIGTACYLPRHFDPALAHPGNTTMWIYNLVTLTGMYLALLVTPLTIGISILRYRLWGIDMIITRTLVYVPLTAILAGVYSATVTLCQKTFIAFTGNTSDAAIVMSTLILATLFTPVKNALQAFVDRRFKTAPDAACVLKTFNEDVRNEISTIDPRRITHRLLDEATHAFSATSGAIYLGPAGLDTLVHTAGEWTGTGVLDLPLAADGRQVGRLILGSRPHTQEYTDPDRTCLTETLTLVAESILSSQATPAPAPIGALAVAR